MAFYRHNNNFLIKKIRHNKRDELRNRWFEYRIISKLPQDKVKDFCMSELIPIERDNPFIEVVEFRKIANSNEIDLGDTINHEYSYIVKKESTY